MEIYMKKNLKILSDIMICLSAVFAVAHFIWCMVDGRFDLQSLMLNVIPYGLPIIIFVVVRCGFQRENPRWDKSDSVFAILFSLIYLAMVLHVTFAGAISDFADIYFNVPVIYAIVIAFTGLAWGIARTKPNADTSVIFKVLYVLVILTLAAMVVHCGILFIGEWIRMRNTTSIPSSSFPWWTMPLLIALLYIVFAGVLFFVYYTGRKL